jgi:hypothetical protein
MQDWIKTLVSYIVAAVLTGLTASVKHLWTKQKAQEEGLKALLHDRIYQGYADCLKKGYASVEDIENLEYLYSPYHTLGGNGTGTELFERVKKMPVEPEERGSV